MVASSVVRFSVAVNVAEPCYAGGIRLTRTASFAPVRRQLTSIVDPVPTMRIAVRDLGHGSPLKYVPDKTGPLCLMSVPWSIWADTWEPAMTVDNSDDQKLLCAAQKWLVRTIDASDAPMTSKAIIEQAIAEGIGEEMARRALIYLLDHRVLTLDSAFMITTSEREKPAPKTRKAEHATNSG